MLIVDDEEPVRSAVGMILKRAGFGVVTAADGPECLEVLSRRNGDVCLVVLDCNMPRMSGAETLEAILERDAGMPVLLSSGNTQSIARDRPNVAFIQKPYRAKELVSKIATMIGN